jgi:thiamine biosynthesis protein ThiI
MQWDIILIRYGELSLKSAYVRRQFESVLIGNIRRALTREKITGTLTKERGRVYLSTEEITKSCAMLQRVFGIVSFSPAVETTSRPVDISSVAVRLAQEKMTAEQSFAVRASRTGTHSFTSQDIAVKIGSEIVQAVHASVDLTNPDVEVFIEIRNKRSFLFTEKIKGAGGLPLRTQGTVVALIDEPASLLAAWFLMHRGCTVICVNTRKENEELLHDFLNQWYVSSDIISLERDDAQFLPRLLDIIERYHGEALVSGRTLENPESTLLSIAAWKQQSHVPLLLPLIAMDEKEIRIRCTQHGITL